MREVIIQVSDKDFETYFKQDPNVRELILCKDCKHWYQDADVGMACEFTNMAQLENCFCNWGERNDWPANDL